MGGVNIVESASEEARRMTRSSSSPSALLIATTMERQKTAMAGALLVTAHAVKICTAPSPVQVRAFFQAR